MSVSPVRESPRAGPAAPRPPPPRAPRSAVAAGPSAFARLVGALGTEVKRGEALVRDALGAGTSGRDLAPAELIALQAGVYRYGEVVDLASRLIDRAATSVKTVLDGQ